MSKKDEELHNAAIIGNIDKMKKALTKNLFFAAASINAPSIDGTTALHLAAKNSQIEAMHFLLENGADINICDNEHRTALHISAKNNQEKAVQFLLENNADIHIRDSKDLDAFLYALQVKNENMAVALIPKDKKLLEKEIDGKTPISIALELNFINCLSASLLFIFYNFI